MVIDQALVQVLFCSDPTLQFSCTSDLTSLSMEFFISTRNLDKRTPVSSAQFDLFSPRHIPATFVLLLHMPLGTVANYTRIKYTFQCFRTESPAPQNVCYLMD